MKTQEIRFLAIEDGPKKKSTSVAAHPVGTAKALKAKISTECE